MPVIFTKTFVHAGLQLVAQRRLIPVFCRCGRLNCQGLELIPCATIATIIPDGEAELLLHLRGADDTIVGAQQLIDLFGPADAAEALEILQAAHYEVNTLAETNTRLEALRQSILTRIPAKNEN